MFSGHGSQYINMGLELYQKESVFRHEMDKCFDILKTIAGYDFKEILYPRGDLEKAKERLDNIRNTGVIKFIFEYSLAKLLMSWGIQPKAAIGHSLGEYTAACLAGVFSQQDGLKLVVLRGQLLERIPSGAMISVNLPEDQIKSLLKNKKDLSLAAVNSTSICTVSGPSAAIDSFKKDLDERGHESMLLKVRLAFHSAMIRPILKEFATKIAGVKFKQPKIPYISNITGDWQFNLGTGAPGYWADHLVSPVQFSRGLEILLKKPLAIFVQVGPDRGLTLFVNQHKNFNHQNLAVNLVRHQKDETADVYYLLQQLGFLWREGVNIHWPSFYAMEKRVRVSLPTYSFEGQRYCLDTSLETMIAKAYAGKKALVKRKNIVDWLYRPSWKRSPLVFKPIQKTTGNNFTALIFSDLQGLGSRLIKGLEERGYDIVTVITGTRFKKEDQGFYQVNPKNEEDYISLFKELQEKKRIPQLIIHLWNIRSGKGQGITLASLENDLDLGFYSLLHIARAIGKQRITEDISLKVVTDGVYDVVGEENQYPLEAVVMGAVMVIPLEYTNIDSTCIDILFPEPTSKEEKKLAGQLLPVLTGDSSQQLIACRNNHFWELEFEPLPLEKPPGIPARLRNHGVYLVTGGLGGIGLVLAEFLAKIINARLVLTCRSPFPAKSDWENWLKTHIEDEPISQKIKKMMDIEKQGGEVLILSADVADEDQMYQVINRIEKEFGAINGVIHAAGLADYAGIIQKRTQKMTEEILTPKVRGTLILDHLTKKFNLDFFLICSSLASIIPSFGEVGYTAANIFLDAFAHYKTVKDGTFTVSVNWDTWKETGVAVKAAKRRANQGKEAVAQLKDGILSSEGVDVFTRILESPVPQMIVSTKDLHMFLRRFQNKKRDKNPAVEESGEEETESKAAINLRPRPELSTPYVVPTNKTQQVLVKIWQNFFGIDGIGVKDDFFELGGDSLIAAVLSARMHKRLKVRVPLVEIFQGPTIKELSVFIESRDKEDFTAIEPVEEKEFYPLSPAQKRLYVLQQLEPLNISYNFPMFIHLQGEINKKRLEKVFRRLIGRHESLRTLFIMMNREPVQRVLDHVAFAIDFYKCVESETKAITTDFVRPFDLSVAPLLRVGLIEVGKANYIFMMDMHHIVTDGTSQEILIQEFITLAHGGQLLGLKLRYKDYVGWQHQWLESDMLKKQEDYWLKGFAGEIPVIRLPTDYPRPKMQSFAGRHIYIRLSTEETRQLKKLAEAQDATYGFILFI
jgi:acyl transferase domain-containing protein